MLSSFCCRLLVITGCSFLLFGCGSKEIVESSETEQVSDVQISCIAVLPAASLSEGQVAPVYIPKEKNERRAVQTMNEILSDELGGKDNIRFVGSDQVAALDLSGGESQLMLARLIGEKMNCNAVLESTVKRFTERVGGRYSVESPASVAFEMRLISLDKESILWSAKFDESQKSVMENIYEWKKANTRGFVWITASELMREGVRSKLAASPYFKPAEK